MRPPEGLTKCACSTLLWSARIPRAYPRPLRLPSSTPNKSEYHAYSARANTRARDCRKRSRERDKAHLEGGLDRAREVDDGLGQLFVRLREGL